ncbi:MAG: hypothetical protein FWC92_10895, partial [Defluviitaleaceae bacterium]|nr:hypothetical protein [Defluviitaleaceae bacterium]
MKKPILHRIKELIIGLLILTLITPSIAQASPQPSPSLPDLPEIEPLQIESTDLWPHDPHAYITQEGYNHWDEASTNAATADLSEPDQATIDNLQNQQANDWQQCPLIQESFRFYDLSRSTTPFSRLSESDRRLVLRQLAIAPDAYTIANELFMLLEQNGHTLSASIDLMVVMSSGLFSYSQALSLITTIPCMLERNTEIKRFEQLIQNFEIPYYINTRRLVGGPGLAQGLQAQAQARQSRIFADIQSFISPSALTMPYSFIETAFGTQVVNDPFANVNNFANANNFATPGALNMPNAPGLDIPNAPGLDTPNAPASGAPNNTITPPHQHDPTTHRNSILGNENDITTRRAALTRAFTNQGAFHVALNLLLDNRTVAEIGAVFALGAVLQVEPQTLLLPPGVYRAESAANAAAQRDSISNWHQTQTNDTQTINRENREHLADNGLFHAEDIFIAEALPADIPLTRPTPPPPSTAPPPPQAPSMPTPVRAVLDLSPSTTTPFDIRAVQHLTMPGTTAEEVDAMVEYGLEILGFGIAMAPMS